MAPEGSGPPELGVAEACRRHLDRPPELGGRGKVNARRNGAARLRGATIRPWRGAYARAEDTAAASSEWRIYPPSDKLNRSVYPTITDGHQSGLRRNRRGDGRNRQRVRAARPALRDVAGSTGRSRRVHSAADGRRRAVAETSRSGRGQPGRSRVPEGGGGGEGQPDAIGQAPVQ